MVVNKSQKKKNTAISTGKNNAMREFSKYLSVTILNVNQKTQTNRLHASKNTKIQSYVIFKRHTLLKKKKIKTKGRKTIVNIIIARKQARLAILF